MSQTTAAPALEQLAERYGQAWNSQDLDAIVATHAEDGIFHLHVPDSEPVRGREAIRAAFAGFLEQLPDIHFEPVRLRTGPGFWVLESVLSGTFEGAPVAVDFLDVVAVDGHLITRKDSYLDALSFERQREVGS
jgi:hypothetical protein